MPPHLPLSPIPEEQRQEYLQALGIDTYLPRNQLPGAPVSMLAQLVTAKPDLDEESTLQTTKEISQAIPQEITPTQPHKSPAPIKPTPRASSLQPVTREKPSQDMTAEPAAPAKRQQKEEIRLQLLCVRASADLAVINAMPHLGPMQLSPRHLALLVNMLRASGLADQELQVEEKPFRWPMVTGLHVDNSSRAAASALKAYLLQKRADWQFGKILVMGEEVISRLYRAQGKDSPEQLAELALEKGDWQVVYTRSLDEILHSPALKKEVWVALRTLRP